MMNKLYIIKELSKRIANGREMIIKFPHLREEYLEETLRYSQIVYQLMKESVLP